MPQPKELYDVITLRKIIRNVREAVETEIGAIVTKTDVGEHINNLPMTTYIELLRGVMVNMPKNFNMNTDGLQ